MQKALVKKSTGELSYIDLDEYTDTIIREQTRLTRLKYKEREKRKKEKAKRLFVKRCIGITSMLFTAATLKAMVLFSDGERIDATFLVIVIPMILIVLFSKDE